MPVLLKIMVEEDKGWLPSAPLDMKYDNNICHRVNSSLPLTLLLLVLILALPLPPSLPPSSISKVQT